jgi:hypothetical protein
VAVVATLSKGYDVEAVPGSAWSSRPQTAGRKKPSDTHYRQPLFYLALAMLTGRVAGR